MRRAAHLIAVVLVLAGAGCAKSTHEPDGDGQETAATPAATTATQSATDPVDAAVRFVASTDALMSRSPIGRREILRQLVAPDHLADCINALDRAAAELAEKLDMPIERLVWVEAPLTAELSASTATSATVDVWTVSVLGSSELGSPQQVWRTVHIDLELVDGDWLVTDATADAGPTPASNELALQATWSDFEVVSAWPPAIAGADL